MYLDQTLFSSLLEYSEVFWMLDVSTLVLPAYYFQTCLAKSLLLSACHHPHQEIMLALFCMWHQMEIFVCHNLTPTNLISNYSATHLVHSIHCTHGPVLLIHSSLTESVAPSLPLPKSDLFFKVQLMPPPSS